MRQSDHQVNKVITGKSEIIEMDCQTVVTLSVRQRGWGCYTTSNKHTGYGYNIINKAKISSY